MSERGSEGGRFQHAGAAEPELAEPEIRAAREADIADLLKLIRELAAYEKAAPEGVPVTDQLLRESLFGSPPAAEAMLACIGTQIAGYAIFFHNFSSWRGRRGLYLEDLFVRPQWRRRGIGKALLRKLAAIAIERGCARMEWLVLDWNQRAIDFYRSLGAIPLEEWTTFRFDEACLRALAAR